jgi:hypothetical protein
MIDGPIQHIILAPGKGLRCRCGEKASRFILCRRCRQIVATCFGHQMTMEQERDAHCKEKR